MTASVHTEPFASRLAEAGIEITETMDGKRSICVKPRDGTFIPVRRWTTSYPLDLIAHVLDVKGRAYLCDEIMRDEDPRYIQHHFEWDILSYFSTEAFSGARILDFGAGCGASTMVLARMFPSAEVVSVELVPEFIALAEHRAAHYNVSDRVRILRSPDPSQLPKALGNFDFIVLSAVYEHLFPKEREMLLPLLWQHLKTNGVLFINQTPYRWFPIELHTTGLPFINYFPDSLALLICQHLSRRVRRDESWPELLRRGIRGGTIEEIIGILKRSRSDVELLTPSMNGLRDDIDLWFGLSSSSRWPCFKKTMRFAFKAIKMLTGMSMIPSLSLAIRKKG
jgi:2-polyprenyl-3-methyl-5-hydroxy-6-metoxy-1,4-benzoquinol methylase